MAEAYHVRCPAIKKFIAKRQMDAGFQINKTIGARARSI
jgi:hypothetical protein